MSLSLHGHINSFIPAASKTLLIRSVLVANYLCAFKNYLACNVFNSHDLMSSLNSSSLFFLLRCLAYHS